MQLDALVGLHLDCELKASVVAVGLLHHTQSVFLSLLFLSAARVSHALSTLQAREKQSLQFTYIKPNIPSKYNF